MNVRGWWLACVGGLLISGMAHAEDAQAPTPKPDPLPTWAPGPMTSGPAQPIPGRVASRNLGLALTLPPSWRADDVSWRELSLAECEALNPLAEAGLVIELAGKGGAKETLLTFYRVPLKPWREADKEGKGGPGLPTLTTPDKAFMVIRAPERSTPGRYTTLRNELEDAVGTLALYDAHHEERHLRPEIGSDYVGTLNDGSPLAIHLQPGGNLTLTYGKKSQQIEGKWLQREAQVIAHLTSKEPKVEPQLLLHFDGKSLIVIQWDQSVFGPVGGHLEAKP